MESPQALCCLLVLRQSLIWLGTDKDPPVFASPALRLNGVYHHSRSKVYHNHQANTTGFMILVSFLPSENTGEPSFPSPQREGSSWK